MMQIKLSSAKIFEKIIELSFDKIAYTKVHDVQIKIAIYTEHTSVHN